VDSGFCGCIGAWKGLGSGIGPPGGWETSEPKGGLMSGWKSLAIGGSRGGFSCTSSGGLGWMGDCGIKLLVSGGGAKGSAG
jgi:hypothetical protein